jgi:hypothetical protein
MSVDRNEFYVSRPPGGGVGLLLLGEHCESADALLSPDQARHLGRWLLRVADVAGPIEPPAEAPVLVPATPNTLRVMR